MYLRSAFTMLLWTCMLLCGFLGSVTPHGYLWVPLQRSSMWRGGFNVTVNYDDNGLRCGGPQVQFNNSVNGRCGICGDPWNATKENEAGGKYATGTISKTYQEGDWMAVEVKITSNHKGYFEFRLCPHNDVRTPATQACLDRHLLQVEDNGIVSTKYQLGPGTGIFKMNVRLPPGITCSQCVFQWKYRTGNSWGCDSDSDCGLGKGPQEHFINCADIAITGGGQPQASRPPPAPTNAATQQPSTAATATVAPATPAPATAAPVTATVAPATSAPATAAPATAAPATATVAPATSAPATAAPATAAPATPAPATAAPATPAPATPAPSNTNYDSCRATEALADVPGLTKWCKTTCSLGVCPPFLCQCGAAPSNTCRATEAWKGTPGMTKWCRVNCAHVPSFCPKSHCDCS